MKVPNKKKFQQITSNHSSTTLSLKVSLSFTALQYYNWETFSILVNDATLLSDNSLRLRKNLL